MGAGAKPLAARSRRSTAKVASRGLHPSFGRQSAALDSLPVGDGRPDRRQRAGLPLAECRARRDCRRELRADSSELFQVRIFGGPARGPLDSAGRAGGLYAPHLHVPARRYLPPQLQHAVPVGVRRQRRGRHGAHQVSWSSICYAASPADWRMPSCCRPPSCR